MQSEDFSGVLVPLLRRAVVDAPHALDAVHVVLAQRLASPARAL